MAGRVFITGIGVISGIGLDVEENYNNLCASKSGIGHMTILDSFYKDKLPVCEIKKSNTELVKLLGLDAEKTYSRGDLVALKAVKEAIASANLTSEELSSCAFVNSTTVGGMDISEDSFSDTTRGEYKDFREQLRRHDCGDIANFMIEQTGIGGFTSTISTACSSAANAIMLGGRLIKSGRADRVIVGGVDVLSKFTLNGFNALYILSDEPCKPFSGDRKGLNLGEGAGYVVLESERVCANKPKLAEVVGYANANDAHHQTASSPDGEGAYLAIKETLEVAGVSASEVDYVNVHGTATRNNDSSESKSLGRIFGENVPPYSSTKGFTGHTLAAAGALEAVYSVLAITRNTIFSNINFSEPMEDFAFPPQLEIKKDADLNYVLSNSFGFGGNCSSVLFKAVK